MNLEQLSPGQPIRVKNDNNGLWDLTGTVIDIRPDELSYVIDIEGRTFVRGRPKSESLKGVGVSPVESEISNATVPSNDTPIQQLRRSPGLQEKCVPGLYSSFACGLSSGTGVQHEQFSYLVPCTQLMNLPAQPPGPIF